MWVECKAPKHQIECELRNPSYVLDFDSFKTLHMFMSSFHVFIPQLFWTIMALVEADLGPRCV